MKAQKRPSFASLVAVLLALSFALGPTFACASSTNITSEPSGAEVRLDGAPIGQTPVSYTEDSVWLWTKHTVVVDKKGYNSTTGQLSAQVNGGMMVLGIIGFFFCFFPGLFALVGEYRPNYHFVLTQKQAADLMLDLQETAAINFGQ